MLDQRTEEEGERRKCPLGLTQVGEKEGERRRVVGRQWPQGVVVVVVVKEGVNWAAAAAEAGEKKGCCWSHWAAKEEGEQEVENASVGIVEGERGCLSLKVAAKAVDQVLEYSHREIWEEPVPA